MKPKRVQILTILFLATAGPLLQAQFGPPNGLYRPEAVSALIDRVHGDLNRGYEVWHLRGSDRDRLTHAEHQLRNFAQDWSRGKFDKGDLDESIAAIQHVLDNNRLTGRGATLFGAMLKTFAGCARPTTGTRSGADKA
jgi:hypothetical protein